jgi:hypothetical protein
MILVIVPRSGVEGKEWEAKDVHLLGDIMVLPCVLFPLSLAYPTQTYDTGWLFIGQLLLSAMQVVNDFAAPIATQRLLFYLEHAGRESTLKPWVWLLWLGAGPGLSAVAQQLFFYLTVSPSRLTLDERY